jgi:hypothetical protein
MSINGVSAGTLNGARAASSDGVDDFGLADGPQDLPEQEQFGLSFVVKSTDARDGTSMLGVIEGPDNEFIIQDSDFSDGSVGELKLRLESPSGRLRVETVAKLIDSTTHLVCINKTGPSASDVEMYADDMSQQLPTTISKDNGFSSSDYAVTSDMGFFAREEVGSITGHKALGLPFIEFNEEPYSQQDRLDLKQRAPGL